MRIIESRNNGYWRVEKANGATAGDIAAFAAGYRRNTPGAWCVSVLEREGSLEAEHVRELFAHYGKADAVALWVSDGTFAQLVWRR